MKILISADIHGRKKAVDEIKIRVKKEKIDLVICAGDMSVFERDIELILEDLNSMGVPVLLIPGNHENIQKLFEISEKFENLIDIHEATYQVGDYVFVGFGNPGFALIDRDFEKFVAKLGNTLKGKKVILVTHGPPYNTKLDYLDGEHVGCTSIRKFIEQNDNIILAVSGHLHENFGVEDKIGKIKVINPGPYGKVIEI